MLTVIFFPSPFIVDSMKIDKITLCNLTSLAGEQVVDFTAEPLRSAGLFAITGDTGAGKSTLLDAVCLALYNKSPRLDGTEKLNPDEREARQDAGRPLLQTDDVRNLMRRGCTEAYARVEFSLEGGRRFEAGWQMSLNRNGKPRPVVQTLRQLAPHREEVPAPEVAQRIVELVGLDYTQFTRTVLLAQNSFANFLKAKRMDKSALLEKLTGTEIYGQISQKIYARYTAANTRMEMLSNDYQTAMARCLDEADYEKAVEEEQLVSSQLKNHQERLTALEGQLKSLDVYFRALERLKTCEAQYAEAHRQYVSVHAQEEALRRHDQVLEVQPVFQAIKVREADIAALRGQEEENRRKQEQSRQQVEQSRQRLQQAVEREKSTRTALSQRQPALKKGYALSGAIRQAEGQLESLRTDRHQAQLKLDELRLSLATRRREREENHRLLADLEQQRQSLLVHQRMFDSYELLLDKFRQLAAVTDRQQQQARSLTELQKRKATLQASVERMARERNESEARLQTLRNELKIHQQANSGHEGGELQQQVVRLQDQLTRLEGARTLWLRISEGFQEVSDKQAAISRDKTEIEQMSRSAARLEQTMEVQTEHFNVLQRSHLLSQSKDIVRLRSDLKEGRPCPLCGATHHPYHTETERELGQLIDNIEQEYNEARQRLEQTTQSLAALREQISAARSRCTADEDYLSRRCRQVEADVETWKRGYAGLAPSFADCSPTVNPEGRRMMIEQLLENTVTSLDVARQELDTYNRHQAEINRINSQMAAIDQTLDESREQLGSIQTAIKVCQSQADNIQRQWQDDERQSGELYERIDSLSTLSAWLADWQKNRDAFRLKLTGLYEEWKSVNTRLDAARTARLTIDQTIRELEATEAATGGQVEQLRDRLRHLTEVVQNSRKELELLFGKTSPEAEAERLEGEISKAAAEAHDAQTRYEAENEAYQSLKGTGQNLLASRLRHQEEVSRRRADLDYWIQQFNATHAPLQFAELERIFGDGRDWTALRRDVDARIRRVTIADNELQSARAALLEAQGAMGGDYGENAAVRQELQQQADDLARQIGQWQQRAQEVSNRLYAHRLGRREADEVRRRLDEATALRNEWWQLNALLGSADGKRFRELAQSYTFRLLVEQANRQLERLSPRYRLYAPKGSLTLEIIDRDMCDEHRFVSSLSGGETFVVSLALALGLSSMSSRNLAIGSLFIDEGFGNLDHESLDLVMNALGNLENAQGRKVGVISHTEQIRNQISPQIRLVKTSRGGCSRIEVG